MTLKERNIWHLPLLILAFWLGGCSMQYEDIDQPQLPKEDVLNLVLNIHTGDRTIKATRADELVYTNNDGVEFEAPANNRELLNTLRVIIVHKATGKIAHNEYLDFAVIGNKTPVSGYDGLKYAVDYNTDYTVYLIGNEKGLKLTNVNLADDYASGDDYEENSLENLTLTASTAGQPLLSDTEEDTKLPVPMTEIFDVHTVTKDKANPDANDVIQNETFFITRAACKFSFYFFRGADFVDIGYGTDNREIKSVKITGLGQKEYLFPMETTYYPPKSDKESVNRDIKAFTLPSGNSISQYSFTLPETGFKISELPKRPENFDGNTTAGALPFNPQLYFPESKGYASGNPFACTISYDGTNYLPEVKLPNLPHGLPRNTHVAVIITIHPNSIEAEVVDYEDKDIEIDFDRLPNTPPATPNP